MVSRDVISLETDQEDLPPRRKKKKKGDKEWYVHKKTYVQCKFDPAKLPMKLNLPMVCKPLSWRGIGRQVKDLSDLEGGYLSGRYSGTSYSLLTGDIHHLLIQIKDSESLCRVMNTLQNQAFEINSDVLACIEKREADFIDNGHLLPGYLSHMNIANLYKEVRDCHLVDTDTFQKIGGISELINQLTKQVQRARYERCMLKLAKAYKGYKIDLPAFLDFRGRIYRCGLLHFHERDLSRSLINFAFSNPEMPADSDEVMEALLYHYKSYPSLEEAGISFNESLREAEMQGRVDAILLGREARHPFQFIAAQKALVKKKIEGFPVTKDASASAFQIMSYFLLDEDMAKSTNLLPSKDKKIQDIYTNILSEVKEYIVRELGNNSLSLIVVRKMDRKMVKSIFMPMIYGKPLMSTSSDIHKSLSQHINLLDSHILASLCFKFWKDKYKGMDSLTSLIRNIGWFAAAKGVPVYYAVPYFRTSQDYMKSDVVKITVYDRNHKRRQISLRVHTDNRDRRKTEVSTFVNFIHQKDAYIAMLVVEKMLIEGGPIYTVHDNFLTTPHYSRKLPSLYADAILELGPPLAIINDMIYANLIWNAEGSSPEGWSHGGGSGRVIPIGELENYLENNMPDDISQKMEATWRQRMKALLLSYESYASSISGVSQDYVGHLDMWLKFGDKVRFFPEGMRKNALHP
ncbi:probable DNA-directed RNA polymerase [Lycium barbarum]|uniref:probable DNA-directed RNA polymerase n=1 Tax=Lycium barbarum TaxID=112863 RepID=UPI00293EDE34|nr:probable DNA-directed RNA polymerase [Lycium barbarum]